ncbi:hypothetical protein H1R20_g1101, partial [Candolleomyces eurysporus]
MAENSPPLIKVLCQSTLYLTNIALEHIDSEGLDERLNIAELVISGLEDSGAGTTLSLVETLPKRWEAEASIKAPKAVDTVEVVAKSDEGTEICSGRLDLSSDGLTQKSRSKFGYMTRMDTGNKDLEIALSWKIVKIQKAVIDGEETSESRLLLAPRGLEASPTFLKQSTHASLPSKLKSLANAFRVRSELMGEHSDIAAAITACQRAIHLTPSDHRAASLFRELGLSYSNSFERTNGLADITNAVTALQKAVDLTSPDDADLSDHLNNLATSLLHRFKRKGDLSDLRKATETLQKAVDLDLSGTNGANHPDRLLINLGHSLRSLFQQTGDLSVIARAIEVQEKAVELTPPTCEELPDRLNGLGCSFMERFEWTGDLSDITKAIEVLQKAVQFTPPDHPRLPQHLENLGNSYYQCFGHTKILANIANAIAVQQKAVGLTPSSHPELP